MDHTPINEKWNGRQVYVGPRGGKYILDAAGMVFEGKHQYANSVDCFGLFCLYSLPIARVPESVDGSDLKSADL